MRSTGCGFSQYADNDQRAPAWYSFLLISCCTYFSELCATALIVSDMQASVLFLLSLRFCVGLWTCREGPNPLVQPHVLDEAHIGVGEEPGPPLKSFACPWEHAGT